VPIDAELAAFLNNDLMNHVVHFNVPDGTPLGNYSYWVLGLSEDPQVWVQREFFFEIKSLAAECMN